MNKGQQELIKFFEDNPNMKQASLGDLVGCGKAYINRMIKGSSTPGRSVAVKLKRHAGIPSGYWDETAFEKLQEADDE